MPTISIENYLKAIWHLQRASERVKTKSLATHLGVAQPSATNMLKALEGHGYVEYAAYRGARLTPSGQQVALKVIRNHRLIEAFLVETLGYSWADVHDEAERLEHAVSDELIDRIDAFLGHPVADPHGDPIPTPEGRIDAQDTLPLDEAVPGTTVQIVRVLAQEPDILRHLAEMMLVPGAEARVLRIDPYEGPVWLQTEGEHAIGRPLASRLRVRALG